MNAYLSDRDDRQPKLDLPPILIASDGERSSRKAVAAVEASGIRVVDQISIEAASERIARQVASSALWIEIEHEGGEPLDRLLDRVNRDVGAGRYAAVVSMSAVLIDTVAARLDEPGVELIVDADEGTRAA